MTSVLWISPNFNHYKAKFLRHLQSADFALTVFAGGELRTEGHVNYEMTWPYRLVMTSVDKHKFQYNLKIYAALFSLVRSEKFDVVLMPIEKKHFLLIFYLWLLKHIYRFNLASYNHPHLRSKRLKWRNLNLFLTKYFYRLYDTIIFYTEQGQKRALAGGLIEPGKAKFANNTLDTAEIWAGYNFHVNLEKHKTILFIGRLVKNKRLELLFLFFERVSKEFPDCRLLIIGDGPERHLVEENTNKNNRVLWLGPITDEALIARHMAEAHLVFVPGHSGLSIVHAFAYGKPYVTLGDYFGHPPELTYLKNNENGLILDGEQIENADGIIELLSDEAKYAQMCQSAFNTAKELSIENWSDQIKTALK